MLRKPHDNQRKQHMTNRQDSNRTDTVIVLGAGASRSDGAPLQNQLFKEYFAEDTQATISHEWDNQLIVFFQDFFGIDVRNRKHVETQRFPTFEEVLGVI